jgi:hypothetical protein
MTEASGRVGVSRNFAQGRSPGLLPRPPGNLGP